MNPNPTDLEILYEDNHLIIVNKKTGDISQGDKTGDESLIDKVKKYIKYQYNKPGNVFSGLVHRLDRPTSGVIVFAKTSKALSRLNKMLREGKIKKTYWAVTEGVPVKNEDTLIHYLKKNPKTNKTTVFPRETEGAKKAVLHYKMLKKGERYALLEIDLETGRHHQIRAQLAKIGLPVKGDLKYGAKRSLKGGGIMLHARKIRFKHPVKNEILEITAPVPTPHWEIIEKFK
jgi:23S rRNA pseudouridine1911/1915/1917 synthase